MESEFDSSTLVVGTAIVGVLVIIYWGLSRKSGQKNYKLPPGPRPWPVLGNLIHLSPLLHQGFAKIAEKYGDIFFLRLGSLNAIVVTSPKRAEEVLKTHDLNFAARAQTSFTELVLGNGQTAASASYGPYWRHIRKVTSLELLTPKRIESFQGLRRTCTLKTLESVIKECDGGKSTLVEDHLHELTIQNITNMALGDTVQGQDSVASSLKGNREFPELIRKLEGLATSFVVGDYFPVFRHFDFFGQKKRMREASKESIDIMERILLEHEERTLKSGSAHVDKDAQDFVDVLLTRPGSQDEKPLTRFQVQALLQEVLMAGTITSSCTLNWVFAELLTNPSTLEKAQEELDRVVGRERLVTEADLPRLPYIRAVVKESLRLHPVVPLLVPHVTREDCVLEGGYDIPKNCLTFVNVWAIGRDPALWKNPTEFNPDRFLAEDLDSGGKELKYLPFGFGRRQCPGKALADVMVEYALAVMLHACDWTLPQGVVPGDVNMTEVTGMSIHKATPLEAVASPRLPVSVIFSS